MSDGDPRAATGRGPWAVIDRPGAVRHLGVAGRPGAIPAIGSYRTARAVRRPGPEPCGSRAQVAAGSRRATAPALLSGVRGPFDHGWIPRAASTGGIHRRISGRISGRKSRADFMGGSMAIAGIYAGARTPAAATADASPPKQDQSAAPAVRGWTGPPAAPAGRGWTGPALGTPAGGGGGPPSEPTARASRLVGTHSRNKPPSAPRAPEQATVGTRGRSKPAVGTRGRSKPAVGTRGRSRRHSWPEPVAPAPGAYRRASPARCRRPRWDQAPPGVFAGSVPAAAVASS